MGSDSRSAGRIAMRSSTPLARSSGSCLCPTQPSSGRGIYPYIPANSSESERDQLNQWPDFTPPRDSTTPPLHWPTFAPALTVRLALAPKGAPRTAIAGLRAKGRTLANSTPNALPGASDMKNTNGMGAISLVKIAPCSNAANHC